MHVKKLMLLAIALFAIFLVSCSKDGSAITTSSVVDLETALDSSASITTCIDTDGEDTTRKGTTSGVREDGTSFELNDGCHMGFLVEYYCEGNILQNKNIRCPGRCSIGTCVSDV